MSRQILIERIKTAAARLSHANNEIKQATTELLEMNNTSQDTSALNDIQHDVEQIQTLIYQILFQIKS